MQFLKNNLKSRRELLELYIDYRIPIKKRLLDFKVMNISSKEELFNELCFCLLTPQSSALVCDNSVKDLKKVLNSNNLELFEKAIYPVRFYKNKAKHILEAKPLIHELDNFRQGNPFLLRKSLVKNVKGLGLKEASHFLRNIGHDNLAILDRHILKNLVNLGVIEEIPKNLNERTYLDIEEKFKEFASEMNIPVEELDLLLWAKETGTIFK